MRFWWLVTGVGARALGCRLAYVFLVARHVPFRGDSVWYHLVGAEIPEGHGFVNPSLFYGPGHEAVATAQFPPLHPAFVAVLDGLGVTTPFGHQVAGAIIGVSLVPLTALLARRLLGPVLALGAAIFVAVEPTLLAGDGAAMSETLAVPLVTLAVLLIYRARESARVRDWVLAGAVFGLVGLTRSEGPFLYVGIAGVTLLAWRKEAVRRRLVLGLAGLAGVIILMMPWTVRNSVSLDAFVPAATNGGVTLGRRVLLKRVLRANGRAVGSPVPAAGTPRLGGGGSGPWPGPGRRIVCPPPRA